MAGFRSRGGAFGRVPDHNHIRSHQPQGIANGGFMIGGTPHRPAFFLSVRVRNQHSPAISRQCQPQHPTADRHRAYRSATGDRPLPDGVVATSVQWQRGKAQNGRLAGSSPGRLSTLYVLSSHPPCKCRDLSSLGRAGIGRPGCPSLALPDWQTGRLASSATDAAQRRLLCDGTMASMGGMRNGRQVI